jgi:hypothetical protein
MDDGFDFNSGLNRRFEFSFGWTRIFTEMRRATFRHEFEAPAGSKLCREPGAPAMKFTTPANSWLGLPAQRLDHTGVKVSRRLPTVRL